MVDEIKGELTRIGHAIDAEEGVERPGRGRQLHDIRGAKSLAHDVPVPACQRDMLLDEALPLLERDDGRALQERRDTRGRVLDEVLDHRAEFGRRLEPA